VLHNLPPQLAQNLAPEDFAPQFGQNLSPADDASAVAGAEEAALVGAGEVFRAAAEEEDAVEAEEEEEEEEACCMWVAHGVQ